MPNSAHRKVTLRKSIENRSVNRAGRSKISTQTKKVLAAIEAKDEKLVQIEFRKVIKYLDQAVGKGFYHKNTAGRKKSALAKKVNDLVSK